MSTGGPVRSRATSIAAGAIVLLSLTGCTFSAVQANQKQYDASDGFSTTVGSVAIRNAILVTDDGETANLAVNFVNTGVKNVTVVVSWENAGGRVERNVYVAQDSTLSTGPAGNRFLLKGIDAPAGTLFPVFFQYGDEPGQEIGVPVLDGGLAEYTDLVPDAAASE
jgi:hypothetical protein